ncbi:hypothetical protein [Staphylococcus succinus]|uniref:hypothetical protein n=1 Tax=Staphylococcus succinus TaxID=61015 RepID=UPI000E68EE99|nr:hypothetical protein [Staphylococcus succinus]RIN23982.1 hypothetical protein BU067_10895 [Staphylococcus succinus]
MTEKVEVITKERTWVDRKTLKEFNDLYNVNIEASMDFIEVHEQLEKIKEFRCGIVANDFETAIIKVLRYTSEYIINIENTFYLCVKEI